MDEDSGQSTLFACIAEVFQNLDIEVIRSTQILIIVKMESHHNKLCTIIVDFLLQCV